MEGSKLDLKRIEAIFLVAFFSLNIFLFTIYSDGKSREKSETSLNNNIESRLKADDISYSGKLSRKNYEGNYLSGTAYPFNQISMQIFSNQTWKVTKNQLASEFTKPLSVKGKRAKLTDKLNQLIQNKEQIINGQSYSLSEQNSYADNQVTFVQNWNGVQFQDDSSRLVFVYEKSKNGYQIQSYQQTYIADLAVLRDKQSLISERDAITTLYDNTRIPAGSKIKWTRLAYTRIFTIEQRNIYIPAWIVAIQTGTNNTQIERVNAFTSALLSSGASEMKD